MSSIGFGLALFGLGAMLLLGTPAQGFPALRWDIIGMLFACVGFGLLVGGTQVASWSYRRERKMVAREREAATTALSVERDAASTEITKLLYGRGVAEEYRDNTRIAQIDVALEAARHRITANVIRCEALGITMNRPAESPLVPVAA